MGTFKIKKGNTLPINGEPRQEIENGKSVKRVALLGEDYVGLKPTMEVDIGDSVKLGQLLLTDKKLPGVKYTAPGAGKVVEINRGEKRAFLSLVIELEGDEEVSFTAFGENALATLDREMVVKQLVDSGLWTTLLARPFGHVANPETVPNSIFVTAMDTNPLAPVVEKIVQGQETDFKNGLLVLSRLTEGKVFVCKKPSEEIPVPDKPQFSVESFDGPHPAGLPGTHIHFLDPIGKNKIVWHIQAQDVIKVGKLFTTGKLSVEHVVALGGAGATSPRLLRTRVGACLSELLEGELKEGDNRTISGSVFNGHTSTPERNYLGRFHQQITVIHEGRERHFLGWLDYGPKHYSVKNIVMSKLIPNKRFDFNTSQNGGVRAIVPIGSYEKVMPLDILPAHLLKALAIQDVEESEKLGCLELIEEDLALCTFVCPSKIDHGENLRKTLTVIEKEG